MPNPPATSSSERVEPVSPLVSVCITTFNQAHVLAECLEGVLGQSTDFPFEVIVGDDASTDGTRLLLQRMQQAWPDRLRLLLHPSNVGAAANYVAVHALARGRFVAHLDGDDLAFPGKLQRQADVFRARPDASIVAHDVALVDERGQPVGGTYSAGHPVQANLAYLVTKGSFFAHSSKMYRRDLGSGATGDPRFHFDFLFHVEHVARGPVVWLPEVLGARRMGVGISWDPVWRPVLHEGKARALVRAQELGCPASIVAAAQAQNDYAYATWLLERGDLTGFRKAITLDRDRWRVARARHRALHRIRNRPLLLRALLKAWRATRPVRALARRA